MRGNVFLKPFNLKGPIGLVIGNEGEGVSRLVKEHCDMVASIPMKGDIDSCICSYGCSGIRDCKTETFLKHTMFLIKPFLCQTLCE